MSVVVQIKCIHPDFVENVVFINMYKYKIDNYINGLDR